MSYPAGTVEVRGTQYPVSVTDHGQWTAEFSGSERRAESKEELRVLLLKLTKEAAAKVNVRFSKLDFTYRESPRVVHGTATGIHQGNSNVLVTWDSGKKEQLDYRDWSGTMRKLDSEEAAELIRLTTARQEAERALNAFSNPLALRLQTAVEEAIKEQIKEN